jgi:hypothetical protein
VSDEFLELLEHELLGAARRRSRSAASVRPRARRLRADARALGRALLVASSVAAVVLVAGVLLLAGRGTSGVARTAGPARPNAATAAVSPAAARRCLPGAHRKPLLTRTAASPDAATVSLLSSAEAVGARTGASLTHRGVFPVLGHPTVLYTRHVHIVRLGRGLSVALIPASLCGDRMHGARQPITRETRDLILARLLTADGHAQSSRPLGTVRAINSGRAFSVASPLVTVPGHHRTAILAMVPRDVVAIVCRGTHLGQATRRFVAHDRIVLVGYSTYRDSRCGYERA